MSGRLRSDEEDEDEEWTGEDQEQQSQQDKLTQEDEITSPSSSKRHHVHRRDEDDGEAKGRKRPRAPKQPKQLTRKSSRFVEMEAEVSDEEDAEEDGYEEPEEGTFDEGEDDFDEEEDEEDEDDDFVDNEIEERERASAAAFERRLAAHAARREAAQKAFQEEFDPESVERRLKQLYGRTRLSNTNLERGEASSATLEAMLQPQPSDPKLWLVKCRPGKERMAVAALMRGLLVGGKAVNIFSVVGRDSLKGFIYVEAYKATDVMTAVQKCKVNHLVFASPLNRPVMVPLAEMADVLNVAQGSSGTGSKAGSLDTIYPSVGSWVRVKRGKYAGDLAQVVKVEEADGTDSTSYVIRIKLLPRLSYRTSTTTTTASGMTRNILKKSDRPNPRPFDPQEAAQYGSVTKVRGFWIYNGEAYKDGFLFKNVHGRNLISDNITPRADELERFGVLATDEAVGSRVVASSTLPIRFSKGDPVVVTKGEFQHLEGTIDSTAEGDQAYVQFDDKDTFQEPMLVKMQYLSHRYAIGDTVRVTLGEHMGKTGMIVSFEEEEKEADGVKRAIVFSTLSNQQLVVPVAYLASTLADGASSIEAIAPKPAGLADEGANLEIHDLVMMVGGGEGESGAGIVLRLMGEERMASVMDLNGQIRRIPFKELTKVSKPPPARYDPAVLRAGERVQFFDANQEGHPATIIQIFRSSAFLNALDTGEVVVKPISAISRPTAYTSQHPPSYNHHHQQQHGARGTASMTAAHLPRHIIGKTVAIVGAGPYKGYVGIVKELTDKMARVELHTDSRVVTVARERIALPGGESLPVGPTSGRKVSTSWNDGRTPSWGSSSSRTPAWGSSAAKTPAWGESASSRTPAWGAASSRTPAWGAASSKTPAWGDSSSAKTPAWGDSSSAKTPAWGDSSSARTPALATSAKTPTWGDSSSTRATIVHGSKENANIPSSSSITSKLSNTSTTATAHHTPALPPWAIPDAQVTLKSTGMAMRIQAILSSGLVQLAGQSEGLPASDLAPAVPTKKDHVRLLTDDRASGSVIGLDGPDAVIRIDGTSDFRIVPIASLVKIQRA